MQSKNQELPFLEVLSGGQTTSLQDIGRNGFQDGFALWKFPEDHVIQFLNSHLAHDGPMLVSNWLAEKALSRKS